MAPSRAKRLVDEHLGRNRQDRNVIPANDMMLVPNHSGVGRELTEGTKKLPWLRLDDIDFDPPEAGVIWFQDNSFKIRKNIDTFNIATSTGGLPVSITVTNTTDETEITRIDISADELLVGRVITFRGLGQMSTASAADSVTLRTYLNGTAIATVVMTPKQVSDEPWDASGIMTVRSVGASGVLAVHVDTQVADTTQQDNDNNVVVDTTAALALRLTVQWNNAKAGNIFREDQGILQYFG